MSADSTWTPSRAELGLLAPAEVAFMVARHQAEAYGRFHAENRCWGISSNALADYALGLRAEPEVRDFPRDTSDLAACERTYRMAPQNLRELMLPVLERYRAFVDERYPGAAEKAAAAAEVSR